MQDAKKIIFKKKLKEMMKISSPFFLYSFFFLVCSNTEWKRQSNIFVSSHSK